ncbi:MAG: hypothetical protein JWM80_360 [Cyanobacteria bacterium RYN_339]|nr:hypothetical protein [Cyanobacteria bacterium RYN_339]
MTQKIEGPGERRENEEPLTWKPWTPPVTAPAVSAPAVVTAATLHQLRVVQDANSTTTSGAFALDEADAGSVVLDGLYVPLTPEAQAIADAIRDAGTVSAVGQVAVSLTQAPIAPGQLAIALERFTKHLVDVSDTLLRLPGVGQALQVFGGLSGVAAGALALKQEIDDLETAGRGPQDALDIAARAAQLVGGFALALSPLCPALAGAGAVIMTAGAALALGKLGWENRDDLKQAAKIVSNNTARIVSNNGSSIVSDHGFGSPAWSWVVG